MLNDLQQYDLSVGSWLNTSGKVHGTAPIPRWGHGVTSVGTSMFVMEGMGAEGKALVISGDCGVTWPLDEADPVFLMRQAFSETSGRSILRQ